ncbi:HEPN domain-containing protein [Pseudomonas sp. Kh13]|uniref:HEPN domain-containing protein n=1 Tax=Pseudomonas sp. Kh13 TaxID=2093744 RepID=UPI002115AD28|nr:HEPN domain-containing protein [Pseudomonas sp. Kh13]
MAPKQLRQAQAALSVLLKAANLMTEYQAFKAFGTMESIYRRVKAPNGSIVCFSNKALESFECLSGLVWQMLPGRGVVESIDIDLACREVLGRWYEDGIANTVECFIGEVEEVAANFVGEYDFYSTLSGIKFTDFDSFNIGGVVISKPCLSVLKSSVAQDGVIDSAWRETKHGLWLSARVKGSPNSAERRFFELVKATCGLLALSCTVCLERGGAAVRLVPGLEGRFKPRAVTWFSINSNSNLLHLKTSFDGIQCLDFTREHADSLVSCEWFKAITCIIQADARGDAESALCRALYWFFDAQADTSLEMKFVKYWSCIECMFSISKSKVTEQIRRGLTALLCYGRHRYSSPEAWELIDRRVVQLYQLRSDAVHDARHDHIVLRDVVDVSKWAAFILIEISMMISQGMVSRSQLKADVECIHKFHGSAAVKTV